MRLARLNWPPISPAASNRATRWPRSAATVAQARPAGPAPTTAIDLGAAAGVYTNSVSAQARGLTRQLARLFSNTWSRQAWLQAMQVLMAAARPLRAFSTHCGSASRGRAIETMSAAPAASTASATSGVLMRLVATSGRPTCGFSLAVTPAKAARGTEVAMVGTRASCQPMPVLMIVAPAASTARACATMSSQPLPPSTKSSIDNR